MESYSSQLVKIPMVFFSMFFIIQKDHAVNYFQYRILTSTCQLLFVSDKLLYPTLYVSPHSLGL